MSDKKYLLPLILAASIPLAHIALGGAANPALPEDIPAFELPRLSLKTATLEELIEVPGIGPSLAGIIITARPADGYPSWGEVRKIKGIGPAKLALLQKHFDLQ